MYFPSRDRRITSLFIVAGLLARSCSGSGSDEKKPSNCDGGTPVEISMVAVDGGTFCNGISNMTVSASELGLFDMSGSVNQWGWDKNGAYPSGPRTDYPGIPGPVTPVYFSERGGSYSYGRPVMYYSPAGMRVYRPGCESKGNPGFRAARS
jgi:hypothetical protein